MLAVSELSSMMRRRKTRDGIRKFIIKLLRSRLGLRSDSRSFRSVYLVLGRWVFARSLHGVFICRMGESVFGVFIALGILLGKVSSGFNSLLFFNLYNV